MDSQINRIIRTFIASVAAMLMTAMMAVASGIQPQRDAQWTMVAAAPAVAQVAHIA